MAKNQGDLFHSTLHFQPRSLSETQKLDWLRLMRTPGIGAVTFKDLINHFGSAAIAIEQINGRQFGRRTFHIVSRDDVMTEMDGALKYGAELVALNEPGYPRWLLAIDAPPPLLYVKGQLKLSERPTVAIVGSRNASAAGQKFASQLAFELGQEGIVICSGLARGIDGAAHEASLKGGTIAVLGGGIDHIYPQQNAWLYQQIAEFGLLVSERPFGFSAQAKDFPRRNRLISGIAVGTIVIEAAQRSGSLSTARFAGEQGRQVLAVPGHPLDPRASGTNRLIQDGASLITCSQDVLELIRSQISYEAERQNADDIAQSVDPYKEEKAFQSAKPSPGFDEVSKDHLDLKSELLRLLGPTPIERDTLVRLLKCQTKDLQILLLELDLEGEIAYHGQQMVSRK